LYHRGSPKRLTFLICSLHQPLIVTLVEGVSAYLPIFGSKLNSLVGTPSLSHKSSPEFWHHKGAQACTGSVTEVAVVWIALAFVHAGIRRGNSVWP
jgi:hypothetical protein